MLLCVPLIAELVYLRNLLPHPLASASLTLKPHASFGRQPVERHADVTVDSHISLDNPRLLDVRIAAA